MSDFSIGDRVWWHEADNTLWGTVTAVGDRLVTVKLDRQFFGAVAVVHPGQLHHDEGEA